ncbi:aspartate aminotransferase family protein [Alkalibacterium pelagium]|uniref:Acetylornithine aminotransferase n=1 Tax=Alkalibacterium pelagium TaxID=426702 RepID=A0A1H7MMY0_9LACT|nr:aspartate aminotransferase family protein [Alkalibacterium pelagium]GEN51165.1 acetylornithine aminotransferase [Alkalibacterium pelagium]SEL12035.1 acetylornithine/N-succinyldiaminopimelate aminotransferase [Alkalibacterium pelagium]
MNTIEMTNDYITPTYSRLDVVIQKAEGCTLTDENGQTYLDFTAGIGVNSLGYNHKKWVEATQNQLSQLQHISNLYYTKPAAELAGKLCHKTGMQHVLFVNSGAESNEVAIKTARKYGHETNKEKHKILTLKNSFHGRTVTTLSATGQDVFHKYFDPFTEGFDFIDADEPKQLLDKADDTVCAIMIEAIQGEGGVVPLDPEFTEAVSKVCQEKDILLIVDEVQTGIGRTGTLFAYEQLGLQPDIVTSAKGLGNGLPIGAVLFGEKVAGTLKAGDHGSTFGGNPVATAGANIVIDTLTEEFLDQVKSKGQYLKAQLEAIEEVADVSGLGLMLGISLKSQSAKDVMLKAKEAGIMCLTAKDKLRLLPPLIVTRSEIDEAVACLKHILTVQEKEAIT